MAKKVKKTKKRLLNPVAKLICIAVIIAGAYLLFASGNIIYTTFKLQSQLKEAKAELQEVQDQNSYLTAQKNKLEDPDYVKIYARENYLLTSDGDKIYYLPSSEK